MALAVVVSDLSSRCTEETVWATIHQGRFAMACSCALQLLAVASASHLFRHVKFHFGMCQVDSRLSLSGVVFVCLCVG